MAKDNPLLERLQNMLDSGVDNALLRFSLGQAQLNAGNPAAAAEQLRRAVEFDHQYSAAWKLLGKALAESGLSAEAIGAYEEGIAVAESKGDRQAAKEMIVFLRRIQRPD